MTHLHAVAGHAELQARAYRRDQDDASRNPNANHGRDLTVKANLGLEHAEDSRDRARGGPLRRFTNSCTTPSYYDRPQMAGRVASFEVAPGRHDAPGPARLGALVATSSDGCGGVFGPRLWTQRSRWHLGDSHDFDPARGGGSGKSRRSLQRTSLLTSNWMSGRTRIA